MGIRLDSLRNIVVIGAGYGGLRAALRLGKLLGSHPGYRITLIDQNRHQQLITQLHEVAGGRTPAGVVAVPLDGLLGPRQIDFHQARITGLDPELKKVSTDRGEIVYDQLVIALGSETNFYNIPGLREHSFTLKSLGDACLIQGHLHEMLARAAAQSDPQARREALTFVIGGGGFTGVELAGELADSLPRLAARYGLSVGDPQITIVEAGKALLPGLHPSHAAIATRILQQKGIRVLLGSPVQSADAGGITLSSGQKLTSRTVIWTGGVRGLETLERWGLPVGASGKVKVNEFLEVAGLPGVYALGDSALVLNDATQQPVAPSAQLAVAQGEAVARNIFARLKGSMATAYRPHLAGEAVSLGSSSGVAWIGSWRFSGQPALWLKKFIAKRYLWETGGLDLVLTNISVRSETMRQDFPQCLPDFRPGEAAALAKAGN